ncbi:MAG: carboxypeptidase-like regulatory domain-containing protein [Acidobacteriota bacterium]
MRSLARLMIFFALVGAIDAFALPVFFPQDRKDNGVITGRVTLDGKPAQGVSVMATPSGPDPAKMVARMLNSSASPRTTTDSDGRYRLESLSADTYNISPSAPALVTLEAASGRKEVIVTGDATVERIDFALTRGGVISGKITDNEGSPLIGALITLKPGGDLDLSAVYTRQGGRMFFTDDRGVYRIFGLPAGHYLVSAGDSGNSPFGQVFSGQRRVKTYYPGVTEYQKARPVEVAAGAEALGVDIKLGVAAKGLVVSGRVIDSATRKPVANTMVSYGRKRAVSARNKDEDESDEDEEDEDESNGYAMTNARGEFRLEVAAAGSYQARVDSMRDMFGGSEYYADPVDFEVRSANLANVEIAVHRGASISGVVVIENTDNPDAREQVAQVFLRAMVSDEQTKLGSHGTGKVAADGTFRIGGLRAGKARIDTSSVMGPAKLSLVRIERDGVDQQDGLLVQTNEQITGVRIIVSEANCVIRGHVTLIGGSLPPGSILSVTARSLTGARGWGQWGNRVDAKGDFVIENLAPGSYEVEAATFALSSEATKRTASDKQTVLITRGSPGEVLLVLDLSAR